MFSVLLAMFENLHSEKENMSISTIDTKMISERVVLFMSEDLKTW